MRRVLVRVLQKDGAMKSNAEIVDEVVAEDPPTSDRGMCIEMVRRGRAEVIEWLRQRARDSDPSCAFLLTDAADALEEFESL